MGFSFELEEAFETALMLRGQARDHGAGSAFVRKGAQRGRDRDHERLVSMLEREAQLRRGTQPRVGAARVVERPLDQLGHEVVLERSERRALGPSQYHHDLGAMRQAVVEQVAGERVVFGVGAELAHVLGCAQCPHPSASAPQQLSHQLGRYGGLE
jgi:hypothetical protein